MSVIDEESINKLRKLVNLFEENEKELTDVPQDMVEKFGYSCLANSLMFKKPKLPEYDEENITQYMKTHEFSTISNLCDYINSLSNDIDKLFAIFCWAALNIKYDVKAYFSNNIRGTSLEKVFKTKLAVCDGFSLFFKEMSKRVNIVKNRIKIKRYSNYAKGYGYRPFNPPSYPESNHSSIYIEIDGNPFICEPTWASGGIGSDHKLISIFDPQYFLIPLYQSLNDHYPCECSSKIIPFKLPFKDFLKSINISTNHLNVKTESNPFEIIECENGSLEQIYSCEGPLYHLNFNTYIKRKNKFTAIQSSSWIGYQNIQKELPKHTERCRFRVNIEFPEIGTFKIIMSINSEHAMTYYVKNLSKSSESLPLQYDVFNQYKYKPIFPNKLITHIKSNNALIRFAISKEYSKISCELYKVNRENSFSTILTSISNSFISYKTVEIDSNDDCCEDQILIEIEIVSIKLKTRKMKIFEKLQLKEILIIPIQMKQN